jgi:hypothetical protein
MILISHELKKAVRSPMVWGFLALCIALNIFLVLSGPAHEYDDFVSRISAETGIKVDASFYEKLDAVQTGATQTDAGKTDEVRTDVDNESGRDLADDNADGARESAAYIGQFRADTEGMTDVFENFDAVAVGEAYVHKLGIPGVFAELMRGKYKALQTVTDEKAKTDDGLSLYFAGDTRAAHRQLFMSIMGFILKEGAILAALILFLIIGYERISRTEGIVYAGKTGRGIVLPKLAASLLAGLSAYGILAGVTLAVFFGTHDFGGIWESNVSSGFNFIVDYIADNRPFTTWAPMTVTSYLLASLGVSALLILCFVLMAYWISLLSNNPYAGFLIFILLNAGVVAVPSVIPAAAATLRHAVSALSMLSPMWLSLKQAVWFTDGDADILWPWFETTGVFVSLAVSAVFCIWATRRFYRRSLL